VSLRELIDYLVKYLDKMDKIKDNEDKENEQ
jgi:hypothetical protein